MPFDDAVTRFYLLDKRPVGKDATMRTEYLPLDSAKYGDAPTCIKCGKYVGMRQWLPPFEVDLETYGAGYGDIAFGVGNVLLVSHRFKSLYNQSGLTGLSPLEEVEVRSVSHRISIGSKRPRYFAAAVVRSGTALDQTASHFDWATTPRCPECQLGDTLRSWERIVVDEQTYNGEDILVARGLPGEIIVSHQFRSWCLGNNLRNAAFVPTDEASCSFQ